jgi:chaperonin cofactor prefoldin
MDRQARIDTLRKALAAINRAIAQTQAALRTANSDDTLRLTSQLADLQAERQRLGFELDDLQMAAGEIADISPDSAARITALSADLDRVIIANATVSATLDFATTVLSKVSDLRDAMA